jgi:hypothetical protein
LGKQRTKRPGFLYRLEGGLLNKNAALQDRQVRWRPKNGTLKAKLALCSSHTGDAALVRRGYIMILSIAAILFVLWLLGFFAFHIAGGLIHLLLIFVVIAVIWHFVAGRRSI